jgi:hypothetical protein
MTFNLNDLNTHHLGIAAIGTAMGIDYYNLARKVTRTYQMQRALAADKTPIKGIDVPEGVFTARTEKQLQNYLNKNHVDNFITRGILKETMRHGNNAAFLPPTVEGHQPLVLLPPDMRSGKVLAHEVGHYKDFAQSGSKDFRDFHKYTKSHAGNIFQRLADPVKHDPIYQSEVRAWDHTPFGPGDPVREAALGTYAESALGKRRRLAQIGILGASLAALKSHPRDINLGKLIKRAAESYTTTGSGESKLDIPKPDIPKAPNVNTKGVVTVKPIKPANLAINAQAHMRNNTFNFMPKSTGVK